MKKFLKDYFTFNKRDRNGILVLLCLIFLLLLGLNFMDQLIPTPHYNYNSINTIIAALEKAENDSNNPKQSITEIAKYTVKNDWSSVKTQMDLFAFNPNQLPEDKWKQLGLSEKQIKIIKHYEEKGGKFYKKEDLKKIYGIQEKLYLQLLPYIQIPQKTERDSTQKFARNFKRDSLYKKDESPSKSLLPILVEINSADTLKLKNLKGIGPAFAKRILAYREKLGGFISFSQLYEIWGIDTETVRSIIPQLTLNPSMVRKISLNHCTVSELKKFPYLNYNIANNIVLYRDRHGDYQRVQDIKLAVLVNEELFRKIAPYFTLD